MAHTSYGVSNHWRFVKPTVEFKFILHWNRTNTRTPAFWDTPAAPWLPILVIHIRFQVKKRQSQSCKFWKIAKNSNFEILQETLHTPHLLKLPDKICKDQMDPTRNVGATERTRDAGRTDGQTDGRTEWNQFPPPTPTPHPTPPPPTPPHPHPTPNPPHPHPHPPKTTETMTTCIYTHTLWWKIKYQRL